MKKTLALVLSVLVALSMFTFVTFAEDADSTTTDLVTIKFVDYDGTELKVVHVVPGTQSALFIPKENPTRADTETTRYTFKGWSSSIDGALLAPAAIPNADLDAVYTAEYSEKDITGNQSLLNFIQSIFARINLIFQYFAEIFRFDGQ